MSRPEDQNSFDSAWHKFLRALHHSQLFKKQIVSWPSDNPREGEWLTIRADFEPDREEVVIRIEALDPLPPYWHTTLGDAAFNFRCALDHLAWTLVKRGSSPPESLTLYDRRRITFPICTDRAHFEERHPVALPGVSPDDLAVVARRQPYDSNDAAIEGHWLPFLREINDLDKHREVRPLYLFPAGITLDFKRLVNCEVIERDSALPVPLEVGTEVCAFPVIINGPEADMVVEPHITIEVGLSKSVSLGRWLDITARQVSLVLEEFSELPGNLSTAWAPLQLRRSD